MKKLPSSLFDDVKLADEISLKSREGIVFDSNIPVQEQLTFTARTVAPGEELNQVNCGNLVKKNG